MTTSHNTKTWFITGASRGFGRAWAQAALERGDRVAATARDIATLADLTARHGDAVLTLELDVTDTRAGADAVRTAHAHFGSLDVVVNNAGYGHGGFVEELTDAQAHAQMATNFFGPLAITRAAIPLMRAQTRGHIIQVASIGGIVAFPGSGLYHASKWALEGLSDALAQEVDQFGIGVTIVEPGPFATDFYGDSGSASAPLDAYQPLRDAGAAQMQGMVLPAPSDSVAAMLTLVDTADPPRRLVLGSIGYDTVLAVHDARVATWREWETVSRSADRCPTGLDVTVP